MARETLCDRIWGHICRNYLSFIFILLWGILKPIYICFTAFCGLFKTRNSPEKHAKKVEYVTKQIADWNSKGRKTKLCTARPGWKTMSIRTPAYKDTLTGINLEALDDIINVNTERMVVNVEPLVTMGQLTAYLIPMGWTPQIVPELEELTVGGLVCGLGGETSGHKYGFFSNIVETLEVVVASGEVLKCSKEENSDLFYAIPLSHGTLGFVTGIELKIIKAEKYVKVEYISADSLDDAVNKMTYHTLKQPAHDFVEGFMYSLNKGLIMIGTMTSTPEIGKINSVTRYYKPWFFKHVESLIASNSSKSGIIEYIPLRQYYHRHSQCIFWISRYGSPYANNVLFRYTLGWAFPIQAHIAKSLPSCFKRVLESNIVIQDIPVPIDKMKAALEMIDKEMKIYPLWLCPVKLVDQPGVLHHAVDEDEMLMDIGVYGRIMTDDEDKSNMKATKALEKFILENRGYKALYADVFMTREEIDRVFDWTLYNKVRKMYNCEDAFPLVYDKVCNAARK